MNGEAVCGYRGGADICAWADKCTQFFGASPDSPLTRCGCNLMSNKESREDLRAAGEVATADNITALRRWNCWWRHTVQSTAALHHTVSSRPKRTSGRKVEQEGHSVLPFIVESYWIMRRQNCLHADMSTWATRSETKDLVPFIRISLSCQTEPIKRSPSKIFGKVEALKKEKRGMWLDKHCAYRVKADNSDIYCLWNQLAPAWRFLLARGTTHITSPWRVRLYYSVYQNSSKAKWSENTFPHQEKPSAPTLVPLVKQKTLSDLDEAATIAALRLISWEAAPFLQLTVTFSSCVASVLFRRCL